MADVLKHWIDVVADRPMTAVACAVVVLLYMNLMAGPRVR